MIMKEEKRFNNGYRIIESHWQGRWRLSWDITPMPPALMCAGTAETVQNI